MMPHNFGMPLDLFSLCLVGFRIWMLVDAIRRRPPFYWYLIIFFVPLGDFIYFAMIKLPAGGTRSSLSTLATAVSAPGPSLSELELRAKETPSELNKLAFADALAAEQRPLEASERYRDVLRQASDSKEALHGLARSLLALGRPLEATEELSHLMELDSGFRDYSAALDYAEALWQSGQHDDAIGLLTGLVGVSKRINHRMALAHYLKEQGDSATARNELDLALRDFATQPDFVQRRDRRWADRARKLLAELN
ncbi:MAG TPA: tetratricopeptide repeat protein [Polyangiaceae bacterium]|nr:tetratricopeptide repeat protein [Polyangiaceae bacterium]